MDKWEITIEKENLTMMVLLCCQCHHEIEVIKYKDQKCDWCNGDMMIIGEGTTWPNLSDYRLIAKEIRK